MVNDKQKAIFGIGWTTISTAFTMLAQILRVVILTRFLVKSDFGIVAVVNVVIGFCTTFADLGFASIIMYKQKLEEAEFSSLYWAQMLVFIIFYGILCVLSGIIADWYGEPILCELIPLSALSIIFLGVGKLYDSVLQKRYEFKILAIRNIISNTLSLVLAVCLAYKGHGFYSLIYSTLFQLLFYNIWNLIAGFNIQSVGFKLSFSKDIISLFKMGMYQTLTRVLDFVSNKIDILLIGGYLGTETLGVYDLAKELVLKLVSFIKSIVSSVALPFLSNSNTNDNIVVNRFLIVTKVVAYVCTPICIFTSVFSKLIVQIIYGVSFLEAYPLVAIFALMTTINSVASFFDMLGIAKGRTDLNFYNTLIRVIITVPVVWICCQFNIYIVAFGHLLLAACLFVVIWNVIAKKTYSMVFSRYYQQIKPIIMVFLPYSIVFYILRDILFFYILIDSFCAHITSVILYILGLLPIAYFGLKHDLKELLIKINKK